MKHEETEAELAAPALGKAFPIAIVAASTVASAIVIARQAALCAWTGTVKQAEKMKKKEAKKLK